MLTPADLDLFNSVNKYLRKLKSSEDREEALEIITEGVCSDCGRVTQGCSCMKDD